MPPKAQHLQIHSQDSPFLHPGDSSTVLESATALHYFN